jgi:two-component system, chemotaxis family, chemotaxis protein CheY
MGPVYAHRPTTERGALRMSTVDPKHRSKSPCSVLIVDDDPAIRETLAMLLDSEGYRVQTATNGQEALDQVAQETPALVLLDMQLPIMDGWEFARAVSPKRNGGLRILVMTAGAHAFQAAVATQADGYLAKPFDLANLLAEVHRLCSGAAPRKWLVA